jgi:hypothetical protein
MKQFFALMIIAFVFASCTKTNDFGLANDDNGGRKGNNISSNRAAGILIDPNGLPDNISSGGLVDTAIQNIGLIIDPSGKQSSRTAGILIDPNGRNGLNRFEGGGTGPGGKLQGSTIDPNGKMKKGLIINRSEGIGLYPNGRR